MRYNLKNSKKANKIYIMFRDLGVGLKKQILKPQKKVGLKSKESTQKNLLALQAIILICANGHLMIKE